MGGRIPIRTATLQSAVPLGDPRAPFSMPVVSAFLANAMGYSGRYPTAALLKSFGDESTAEKWCFVGRSSLKYFFFTRGMLPHEHLSAAHIPPHLLLSSLPIYPL